MNADINRVLERFGRKVAFNAVTKQVGKPQLSVPTKAREEALRDLKKIFKEGKLRVRELN